MLFFLELFFLSVKSILTLWLRRAAYKRGIPYQQHINYSRAHRMYVLTEVWFCDASLNGVGWSPSCHQINDRDRRTWMFVLTYAWKVNLKSLSEPHSYFFMKDFECWSSFDIELDFDIMLEGRLKEVAVKRPDFSYHHIMYTKYIRWSSCGVLWGSFPSRPSRCNTQQLIRFLTLLTKRR